LPNLAMVAGLLLRLLVSVRSIGLWLRKELARMNDEFSDEYLNGFALGRRIPDMGRGLRAICFGIISTRRTLN